MVVSILKPFRGQSGEEMLLYLTPDVLRQILARSWLVAQAWEVCAQRSTWERLLSGTLPWDERSDRAPFRLRPTTPFANLVPSPSAAGYVREQRQRRAGPSSGLASPQQTDNSAAEVLTLFTLTSTIVACAKPAYLTPSRVWRAG